MRLLKFWIVVVVLCGASCLQAAPQKLLNVPLESPDSKYSVNVEWDTAGFIGRIRMIVDSLGMPPATVELPQIKPSPANLSWITTDWVACESFVAESGAAFFYVDANRLKGYMVEIFAPEENGDWLVSYTTNDAVSSDSIQVLSRGHSSLFPILLRNLPEDGISYFSPDFPYLLADAVDSFLNWRRQEKFVEMKFLTDFTENPVTGRLVLASIDNRAEIVYFPQGTTTTREMLALTQRQPLPSSIQELLDAVDPPTLEIKWTDDTGQFQVMGSWDDGSSSVTELLAGRFEGISDSVYAGPGVKELLADSGAEKVSSEKVSSIKITDSKTKSPAKKPTKVSPKSKSKKPDRSN